MKAVVVAALAMLLAGGGFAGAAHLITGTDVKNSSLTGSDIKNSSITGADVKNKSLTASDFKGSVKGDQGPAGPAGPRGVTAVTRVPGAPVGVNAGTSGSATATCPAGQSVSGGGYQVAGSSASVIAQDTFGAPNIWTVNVDNTDPMSVNATVTAVAFCIPTG